MSLSVLLNGANGRMGKAIQSIAEEHACKIKYPIDVGDNPNEGIKNCDVVIDFSLRDGTLQIVLESEVHPLRRKVRSPGQSLSRCLAPFRFGRRDLSRSIRKGDEAIEAIIQHVVLPA